MWYRLLAPEGELDGGGGANVSESAGEVSPSEPGGAPPDMDQTLRDAYAAIKARESSDGSEETTTQTERQRDANGRFATAAADPSQSDPSDGKAPTSPTEETESVAAPEVDTNPDKLEYTDAQGIKHPVNISEPPQSLRPEIKSQWSTFPETVRREFHKREQDFHQGVSQYRAAAQFATELGGEFKPYEALLRSQNWSPQALTRDMMITHHRMSTGSQQERASEMIRVASLYNLSVQDLQNALASVTSQPTQVQQQPPREYIELQQRLDRLEQERQQATQASIDAEIRQFESDGKHEFFKLVAGEMGALMTAGRANTLQEAYDKATWANPEVRAKLLAKQQEADRKSAADKAAVARRASQVNVATRGQPRSAPAQAGTMDETLHAIYQRMKAEGRA